MDRAGAIAGAISAKYQNDFTGKQAIQRREGIATLHWPVFNLICSVRFQRAGRPWPLRENPGLSAAPPAKIDIFRYENGHFRCRLWRPDIAGRPW